MNDFNVKRGSEKIGKKGVELKYIVFGKRKL